MEDLIGKVFSISNFDLGAFIEDARFHPALTNFDVRDQIEICDVEIGKCYTFIVSLSGTNFIKLRQRLVSYPSIVPKLEAYYSKYQVIDNKKIGKGKLAAAFPEIEYLAVKALSALRPAIETQRCVWYHLSAEDLLDPLGAVIPKSENLFVEASIAFVTKITKGRPLIDDDTRRGILRAVFTDTASKFSSIT